MGVVWGVFPFLEDRKANGKMRLGLLRDLYNEFRLEQLVDRNTQGNAVLDLVYTDAPELLENCKTSVKPYLSGMIIIIYLCRIIPWSTE